MNFELRSHDALGYFLTDAPRYRRTAEEQLLELEGLHVAIQEAWPIPFGETVRDSSQYPELRDMVRRRNILCDSIAIFAGMSVEAFINWYGVIRIGEEIYQENFERLGIVPKLKTLLLLTDSLSLTNTDLLVQSLSKLAERRNQRVHPKAKELDRYYPAEELPGFAVPEHSRETVMFMRIFFEEFARLIPAASHIVPK